MTVVGRFEPSEIVGSALGEPGYMTGFENSFAAEPTQVKIHL
jgi:hypothetical protein